MAFTDLDFPTLTPAQLAEHRQRVAVGWLAAKAASGSQSDAIEYFQRTYGRRIGADAVLERLKTAIGAGVMDSPIPPDHAAALRDALWPETLMGRLGLAEVPFSIKVSRQTVGASYGWAAPGEPLPATTGTYGALDALPVCIFGAVRGVSIEQLTLNTPAAERLNLRDFRAGFVAGADAAFVDPNQSASASQPASITSGLTPVASGGTSAADAVEDFRRLLARFVGNGGKVERAAFLISSSNAVALRLSGAEQFRDLGPRGGTIGGVLCVASESVGSQIVLLDTTAVVVARGDIELDLARYSTLEMDDAPGQDGTAGQGASTVSMWQNNLVAVRIRQPLYWRAEAYAVQRVSGATYVVAGSPA